MVSRASCLITTHLEFWSAVWPWRIVNQTFAVPPVSPPLHQEVSSSLCRILSQRQVMAQNFVKIFPSKIKSCWTLLPKLLYLELLLPGRTPWETPFSCFWRGVCYLGLLLQITPKALLWPTLLCFLFGSPAFMNVNLLLLDLALTLRVSLFILITSFTKLFEPFCFLLPLFKPLMEANPTFHLTQHPQPSAGFLQTTWISHLSFGSNLFQKKRYRIALGHNRFCQHTSATSPTFHMCKAARNIKAFFIIWVVLAF